MASTFYLSLLKITGRAPVREVWAGNGGLGEKIDILAKIDDVRAWTFDEREHYDVADGAELTAVVTAISTAVLTERALAQGYIDAVLAAADEAAANAAAAPYLDL